ncbi:MULTISPECIES: chalcone isomerase family protein [Flammeovirga]|uniref:Chalcone isomerase n=1 Tax=Flammeovirga agarivorans TaxID=2726742 RepID=A0A7X8XYF7_9BACT|nr:MULTISPECIES: chalcone isomerase family protein [Flammeovirga]NLR94174.1 chalcone isomerase [Flammeovirga agarivorans]
MKKVLYTIIVMIASIISVNAQTTTVSDVTLENKVEINGLSLDLNGAGVRSKYFLSLYVGSLYLPKKSTDANEVLYNTDNKMIQLDIISSLISKEKMEETIKEGFKNSMNGDTSSLQSEIDSFIAVFSDEVEVGDKFQFVDKGTILKAYKNGKELTTIKNEEFQKVLFGIWLGNKPADKKLKNKMLGKAN